MKTKEQLQQRIAELEEENERLKKIVDKWIEELKSSMELKNITMHQQKQIDTLKKILLNGGDKNE